MGRNAPEKLAIGSFVPHLVLGYIWVTLGRDKWGKCGTTTELKIKNTGKNTDIYSKSCKSREGSGSTFDALFGLNVGA